MAAIAVRVRRSDWLLVKLGEQDMRYRVVHRFRSVFQNVRETNVQAALSQADRCVERGEAPKTDVERWNRRPWTQISVLLFKNWDERGDHYF